MSSWGLKLLAGGWLGCHEVQKDNLIEQEKIVRALVIDTVTYVLGNARRASIISLSS